MQAGVAVYRTECLCVKPKVPVQLAVFLLSGAGKHGERTVREEGTGETYKLYLSQWLKNE